MKHLNPNKRRNQQVRARKKRAYERKMKQASGDGSGRATYRDDLARYVDETDRMMRMPGNQYLGDRR